jgi:hypothetical protein
MQARTPTVRRDTMTTTTHTRPSPDAAGELMRLIESGELDPFDYEADEYMGATDCPDCGTVEPDGHCCHGFTSAALTAGMI